MAKKEEAKPLILSKTFWGVLVAGLASLNCFQLDQLTQTELTNDALVLAGALAAIWGRLSASTKIKGV